MIIIISEDMSDNRGWLNHRIHQWGHEYNAGRKENKKSAVETWGVYKSYSPKKAERWQESKGWSKEVDD